MLRLIGAAIFFIIFFYMVNPFYARIHLPLIAAQLEWMHPEYDVKISEIVTIDGIDYFQYTITVNKPMANRPYAPLETGNTVRLKAQANSLCIAPIIVFSLVLAWPGISLVNRLQTFLISLPLIAFIHAIDLPMIFIANIESVHSTNALGNAIRSVWSHILNNGGRQFLALLIFLISIAPVYLKTDYGRQPATAPKNGEQAVVPRRNDACPCGSGKKYKNCCLDKK